MSITPVLPSDTPNAGRVKWNANDTTLQDAIDAIPIAAPQEATVYVSTIGDDANDGLISERPKQTINAGAAAAAALVAGGQRTAQVLVMDAGVYTEDLDISNGVHVTAPAATLAGTITLGNDASITLNRQYATANNQTLVDKGGGTGHGFYRANVLDGRGLAGGFTGGTALRNASNGSVRFGFAGALFVPANGQGVADGAPNFGHVHFWTPDLYLAGNAAVGISAAANSNFIGYIDHVLEIGNPTGTIAIRLTHAAAVVKLNAAEIIADTAYQITNGALYITCPKLDGTRTGTPACELTNVALIGAWGVLDASNPAP